jgi:hypothetical protein
MLLGIGFYRKERKVTAVCESCAEKTTNFKLGISDYNAKAAANMIMIMRYKKHENGTIPVDLQYITEKRILKWYRHRKYCECCGTRIYVSGRVLFGADNMVTIDRVIPYLGYVKGNIGILCMRCNRLKNDATPKELYRLYRYIKRKRRQFLKDSGCSIGTKQKPAGDKHRRRR